MLDLTATREDQNIHGETKRVTRPEVGAQVLQNFAGGCGVAIAIAAIQAMAGVSAVVYWQWPVYIGAFAFGASMAVRSQIDEVKGWHNMRAIIKQSRAEVEASKEKHAREMAVLVALSDQLEEERDALRDERDALTRENARLESENSSLNYEWRKAKANARTVHVEDLVEPEARRNARHLVHVWAATGKRPSRAEVVPSEMSRSQWDAAYTELGRAELLDGARRTEAEMLHALSVKWAEPAGVNSGGMGAPPGPPSR